MAGLEHTDLLTDLLLKCGSAMKHICTDVIAHTYLAITVDHLTRVLSKHQDVNKENKQRENNSVRKKKNHL